MEKTAGIAGDWNFWRYQLVELTKELLFDCQVFNDGFDDEGDVWPLTLVWRFKQNELLRIGFSRFSSALSQFFEQLADLIPDGPAMRIAAHLHLDLPACHEKSRRDTASHYAAANKDDSIC